MTYGDYDPRHDGPVFNSVDEYRKYEEEEKRKRNAQTCGVMLLVWLLLPILILVGKKKNVDPKLIEEAKAMWLLLSIGFGIALIYGIFLIAVIGWD